MTMLELTLGNTLVLFFPKQAHSIKPLPNSHAAMTMLPEGGWGPGQKKKNTKFTVSPFVLFGLSQLSLSSFCPSLFSLLLKPQFTQITHFIPYICSISLITYGKP